MKEIILNISFSRNEASALAKFLGRLSKEDVSVHLRLPIDSQEVSDADWATYSVFDELTDLLGED